VPANTSCSAGPQAPPPAHRARPKRSPWLVGGFSGALLAAAVAAVTVSLIQGPRPPERPKAVLPLPAAHVGPVHGPKPPASGAWIGAWVQPSDYHPWGLVAAVQQFQSQIRAPLTVIHDYRSWFEPFPSPLDRWTVHTHRVLLLSWGGTDTRAIIAGRYDALIRARARALRRLGGRVLLEWRWEMDRPDLRWQVHSPQDFIAAWRHIHRIFIEEGATHVGWVWCPTAYGFRYRDAAAYYPGDHEVDWLCVDAYPERYQSLAETIRPFLEWAKFHPKPVLVGEFGVPPGSDDQQAAWLQQLISSARRMRSVRAYVYFDARGDTLDQSPASIAAYARLAANPFFSANAPGEMR
jgi:hypothetical protein